MRRLLVATSAAFGFGVALRSVSSSSSARASWDDLSSDSLASFAEKAFGVTREHHGVVFTDILGLDSELLAMVPGECFGVILCHPTDERLAALKLSQLATSTAARGSSSSADDVRAFVTMQSIGSSYGGCGPCAVANVLANSAAGKSSNDKAQKAEEEKEKEGGDVVSDKVLGALSSVASVHAANQSVAGPAASSSTSSSGKYHYTAFVADKSNQNIVELDALMPDTPILWGPLCAGDMKKRGAFLDGTAKVLKKYFDAAEGRIDFAAVAVSRV